ncbi:hypothetical protein I316_01222 [Kwoniella heveanensis BCC8398]|uniref:Inner centromere protein ARK-binding domain-containing protein n=1 Tax=Kwoniella heveanensis BCC8398 TaxID=1296120 RepID=A0A1B9H204_9TREE|nr:hypothetical protein I316_01222 [Kwoniella heveanensis BCC8398]
MTAPSHHLPTFNHYAFNLRDGLRQAAVSTLSELEQSISVQGYGWLDSYMESIMSRQANDNVPIAEYMKTPSRTQTVKKTRATTAAAKDRTDKVKGLNARLALSPASKQSSRPPLSPLQPRSLNAMVLSPTPAQSLKGDPRKAKPEKAKPKAKGKRTRSKKAAANDENSPPTSAETSLNSTSVSSGDSGPNASSSRKGKSIETSVVVPDVQAEKEEQESTSPPSKDTQIAHKPNKIEMVEQQPEPEAVPGIILEDPGHVDEPVDDEIVVEQADGPAPSPPKAAQLPPKDLSVIAERSEEGNSMSSKRNSETTPIDTDTVVNIAPDENIQAGAQEKPTEFITLDARENIKPVSSSSRSETEREHKVDPSMPTSFASAPPPISAGTALPVRQVRSSWLSKALGTGAVPISTANDQEGNFAARKSYAAQLQQGQSNAMDFSGLRKSLVPVGGLKRKSGEGLEENETADDKRPEKTAKVANEPSLSLPTRTPGPISRPTLPSKTPSFGTAGSQPGSQGKTAPSSAPSSDGQRSDISKVTKALDDLREKTAAKELAKQKTVSSASAANAARVPQAKSTGAGFLRGLGSIGAGLLGLGGSAAEEEAQRLARELEEERLAEEEFEKLMRQATKSGATQSHEKEDEIMEEGGKAEKKQRQLTRATTPEGMPVQAPNPPLSPEEEEEMVEEQSVIDELLPVDARTSLATAQRQRSITQEPEEQQISTTPTGTPTKHRSGNVGQVQQGEQNRSDHVQKVDNGANRNRVMELHSDDDEEMDKSNDVMFQTHRKILSSSSAITDALTMSTSSHATTGSLLDHAQSIAAKALGVKPATAPVKSLQLAAAAAKKEQAAIERKAQLKEAEARRQQLAKRKAEEDRIKAEEERVRAEEERKIKVAEMEEKRKQRAELEKRKREREEKAAAIAREKADKERAERDAQAARMKAAEEEAARKRKLAAAALTKSLNGAPAPKRAAGQNGPQHSMNGGKGKEPFRPTKQSTLASSTSSVQLAGKMGPSSFRTAENHQTHSSTITLVTQQQSQAPRDAERKTLGPPSRPSALANTQPMRQSNAIFQGTHVPALGQASSVLQQSRVALQTQLDEKAAMIQSEDIVLPDIASEYSDSDDEDRTRDFIPPSWAESPNLRAALEAQASRDPDELFGPIKPLNMEELFKVRTNKFRARTSSANWSRGDGLTKAEEVEYAKRMGFKPMPSNLGHGGGNGQ